MVMPSKVENTSYLIQTTQRSLILKFLLLTLTSVCVLLLPAKLEAEANPAKDKELQILYDTAREFYSQNKFYGARSLFQSIKDVKPGYKNIAYYLTAIEREIETRKSGKTINNSSKLRGWYREGVQLFKKEHFAESRERFLAIMELDPGYSDAEKYFDESNEGVEAGKSKPVVVVKVEPKEGPPKVKTAVASSTKEQVGRLLDAAYALDSADKIAEAIPLVKQALELDPTNREAKRRLAELQDKDAARGRIPGTNATAKVSTSMLEREADGLYREGKLAEAKTVYLEVLSRDPANRLASAMVNVISRSMSGKTEEKTEDSSRKALLTRASAAIRKEEYGYARDLLVHLILENPDDQEARKLLQRIDLSQAKEKSIERKRERQMADLARSTEESRQLSELRKLASLQEYDQIARKTEELLKVRPHWPEVETIQAMALHMVERDKERRLELQSKLSDHRALREVDEAGIPPEKPSPVARPELIVHKTKFDLDTIKEKLQQKVSVNLVEADLSYVLDLLFRATGVNIVANPETLADQQITIHVEQMPLRELLSFISRTYGILFSASDSAVWVTTPDQPFLETQIRHLGAGLTDVIEQTESSTSDVEKLLERLPELIEWPDGSTFYLDRKKNILFLRSTPEALEKANLLIDELDKPPLQVLIEAYFIELSSDDFRDIDVDWNLTSDFGVLAKNGANKVQVDAGTGTQFTGLTRPDGRLQDGVSLTLSGILTDPQFQLVMTALQETNKAKTLSAPRVLAMNNYTAEIEVLQDLMYIENYEVDRADISGSTVGAVDPNVVGTTTGLTSEPIIIPQFADGDEIGFTLRVTPSVGEDHRNITLVLEPEVTEQVDVLTFNLVIPGFEGDAPIERPIISTRRMTTKATIEDGSILVLAGLMSSKLQKRFSKIPILGDLPFFGGLFRSESVGETRKNLLIFVKATLVDGYGRNYSDELGEDEVNPFEQSSLLKKNQPETLGSTPPIRILNSKTR
jgi:tetratricopeptide (TPR) repeat protein